MHVMVEITEIFDSCIDYRSIGSIWFSQIM